MKTVIGISLLGILSLAVACDDGGTTPAESGTSPDPIIEKCPTSTGPTHHEGGTLEADELWTAKGSPHYLDWDLSVTDGHTLTIEPCATVLVVKGKHIQVGYPGNTPGHLVAMGTADRPIKFGSQTLEPWASIYLHAPGTAKLAHVTLETGGGGYFEDGATLAMYGDSELPADPVLLVDHVTVKGSVGTGVYMQRGATFLPASQELTVTESGSQEFPFPLQIEEHAIDALPTGTYTGNQVDEILLRTAGHGVAGGGLTVDATLHERGVPYRMGASSLDSFIIGPAEDMPPATLTIEPGVVMRFEKGAALKVQTFTTDKPALASIRALGTAEKPIVFTSAAAAPKAGDWRGLWFGGRALPTNALDHVRIEYAGFDCGCILNTCSQAAVESEGAVIFTGQAPGPFITNSVFKEIAGHGVTEGYDGTFVNFRPTNTFEGVAGCIQTRPRQTDTQCLLEPECDGY